MNQTTTRRGKIARLPLNIRHQLNTRLENGEEAEEVLKWLNGLPEVVQVMIQHFDARPIGAQNLSQWRAGGFRDWERQQDAFALAERLREEAEELEGATAERSVTDWMGTALGVQLAAAAQAMLAEPMEAKERWDRLKEVMHELERLRRGDHRAMRIRIARDRLETEEEIRIKADMEKEAEKEKQRRIAFMESTQAIHKLAGSMSAEDKESKMTNLWRAAVIVELKGDLELGSISKRYQASAEEELEEQRKALAKKKREFEASQRAAKKGGKKPRKRKRRTKARETVATDSGAKDCGDKEGQGGNGQSKLIKVNQGKKKTAEPVKNETEKGDGGIEPQMAPISQMGDGTGGETDHTESEEGGKTDAERQEPERDGDEPRAEGRI